MDECKHKIDGICMVASRIAGIDCRAAQSTCMACKADINPMQPNRPTYGLATVSLNRAGIFDIEKHQAILDAAKHVDTPIEFGPGTELENAIKTIEKYVPWLVPKDRCAGCKLLKHQMNKWGPDGCERRIKRILAKMRANAAENGIPFVEIAAKGLVIKAIQSARNLYHQS